MGNSIGTNHPSCSPQSVQSVGNSIGTNHPLRSHLDTVESRVPTELLDRMRRVAQHDTPHADVPSEKALVRLHKQVPIGLI